MTKPLAVLIVEDSDSDAQLIVRLLKKAGYEITFEVVETAAQMRAALEQAAWDIVISDYSLPQFDGPAALRLLQATGLELPFIAVSGTMGEAAAVAMMKAGAHDYLMKDNLARLAPAVERELREADTRRERKRAESQREAALAALRESEKRFGLIAETVTEVFWMADIHIGTMFYVSPGYERVWGRSTASLYEKPQSFMDAIHAEDRERVLADLEVQRDLQPFDHEYRIVRPNGDIRWIWDRGFPVQEGLGQVKYYAGIAQDITERKQAEELSRAQYDLAQALSTTTNLDAALRLCLAAAIHVAGMDGGGIYLVDETSRDLDLAVDDGLSPAFVAGIAHYPADSASAQLIQAGRPIYVQYQRLGVPLDDLRRREGLRAIAIIPVLHERQVIACLNITSHTLDEAPVFARRALETIAAQIGGAIARLRVEQALRESEEKFRSIVEYATDGITLTDERGLIVEWNPAQAQLTGRARAEVIGQPLWDIQLQSARPERKTPEVYEKTKALVRDMLASGEIPERVREQETTFQGSDEVKRVSRSAIFSIKTARGFRLASISRDITGRKQAEEALRESEEKFSVAFKTSPYAITVTRWEDGSFIEVNDAFYAMAGFTREETVNNASIGMDLWADGEDRNRVVKELLSGGKVVGQEFKFKKKTGEMITGLFSAHLIQIKNETYILSSINDITDRKRAEAEIQKLNAELEQRVIERTAELARQRERERAILDAMGEGVVFTDLAGMIEYINPAMERLTGFTAQESVGQNARIWQSGQTPPAVYQQMWAAISRGEMWQGEMVNRRQDGRLYEAALTAAPLTNPDRQIIGFVGVQRDITRQKELDRLKDQFVSNVSHELRTPLTNLKLYLRLLDRGQPEKRVEYMQTLHREQSRLDRMIEDLLDISRLDRDTAPVELAPIDLHQLLSSLVADHATMAIERGLTLEFLPMAESPLALAEVSMLTQVVSNLITNALNYTPAGGSVTVQTLRQRAAAQDWITLTVRDTGPGIAAHELPHVFERFYRGEVGRKAKAPGTGLGLAISKEIVEKLDGRITVESQPTEGRGAAFTVWLRPPP